MASVSTGVESCGRDPYDDAEPLREQYSIDVTVHVASFDVKVGRRQVECMAKACGDFTLTLQPPANSRPRLKMPKPS